MPAPYQGSERKVRQAPRTDITVSCKRGDRMKALDKEMLKKVKQEFENLHKIAGETRFSLHTFGVMDNGTPVCCGITCREDGKIERQVKINAEVGFSEEKVLWMIQSFFPYNGINMVKDFTITTEGLLMLYSAIYHLINGENTPQQQDTEE